MADQLAATVRVTTWGAAPLPAEVVAAWIRDGTAETLLAARRREAAERRAVAMEALAGLAPRTTAGAYHVWMELPRPWRSATFAAEARRRGVAVTPAEAFATGAGEAPAAVRLCLGTPRTREVLDRGLLAVRQALQTRAETALAIV